MLPRFIVSVAFLLLVSINCLGQGLITPRRATVDQKREAASEAAQPDPAGTPSPAALPHALPVSAIKIKASIDGQIATVKVEHIFRNETDDVLEGTYYSPGPEGAILL